MIQYKKYAFIVLMAMAGSHSLFGIDQPTDTDFVVGKDGSVDFTTVQDAVNASPSNSSHYTVIYIKNGRYEEHVNVPNNKKNLVFYGEDNVNTVVTYATEKTLDLATLEVYAPGFIAFNLTVENTAGPSYGPAQAVRQEADKSIYIRCRLIGNQDTYRTGKVRSYNKNCYFEGTVDFIFGDGSIVFENCEIYSKGGTAITAASTREYADYGYVFRNCRVVLKKGKTTHLGRPWKDYAAVAFLNCELPDEIIDAGWHNWDHPERESTSRFAEYCNYGPGAKPEDRVTWATMLTGAEAEQYNTMNVLKSTYADPPVVDNWNPYSVLKNSGIPGLLLEGDGFGINEGGNRGPEVTVENESELRTYADSDNPYVIQIKGNITLSERIDIGSNTTITGIDETSCISGNALNITDGNRNVIIRNLNITNPSGDGITVWDGDHVYITHVSFCDCGDGSCDINRGADSITLSWCRFVYPSQADHRFAMIADGAMTLDGDSNVVSYGPRLNVTLHHNWWYTRSDQRMPASTNANVHIYNNYWNCIGNSYCSNAREESLFYSQNNYYDNVNNPCYSENGGQVYTDGNIYNHCMGKIADGTDTTVVAPSYAYLLTRTPYVPRVVTSRAGNVWKEPALYTLEVISDGNGWVSPSGTSFYNEGQLATLEATPYSNFIFKNWSGDLESDSNPLVFYMDSSYQFTAHFESTLSDFSGSGEENTCSVYPNPTADGSFNMVITGAPIQRALVRIYDLNGRLVHDRYYKGNGKAFRIFPGLQSGTYLIRITSGENTCLRKITLH